MVSSSIRQAQAGVSLGNVYERQRPAAEPKARERRRAETKKGGGGGARAAAPAGEVALAPGLRARPAPPKPTTKRARAEAKAAAELTGPFLAPGSLTPADRRRLIAGIETVLGGVYTHLPLKRARYGFDPVQRLRILRSQLDELDRRRLPRRVRRHRDPAPRRPHPLHWSGPARWPRGRAPVPGRDGGHALEPDVHRHARSLPGWTATSARRHPRLLERRADRSCGPTSQRARGRRPP